jgi:hypothetical protein
LPVIVRSRAQGSVVIEPVVHCPMLDEPGPCEVEVASQVGLRGARQTSVAQAMEHILSLSSALRYALVSADVARATGTEHPQGSSTVSRQSTAFEVGSQA